MLKLIFKKFAQAIMEAKKSNYLEQMNILSAR